MAAAQMSQPAPRPDPSSDATELGAILREARQSLKRELSDISDELRIKLSYLQAIEDGRLDDLPGPAYAVGFVRGYATYLGLDAEDIVNRFKAAGAVKGDRTELHLPSPVTDGRLPSAAVLIVAAVLAVCAYGTWYYVSNADKSTEEKVAIVPPKIVESVNTVPVRPLPERGVLDAPAEVPALAPEAAPARPEPASPTVTDLAAPNANRQTAEPRPTTSGAPATSKTPPAMPPKPSVETRPPQPGAQNTTRPAPTVADGDASPVPDSPQAMVVEPTPPAPPAPARSRSDSRRENARVETAPPPPARSITAPADTSRGRGEERVPVDPLQQGNLPWLAPSDGVAASTIEPARTELGRLEQSPTSDRTARPAMEADARTATAVDRTRPAQPRAAEPESTPVPAAALAPRTSVEEVDSTGSVTTLQPSDEQVAMNRAAEGARRISIHAKVDTWVEVRRGGGSPVFSKLMKAGEAFNVPAQPGFKLSTGNAAGIDLLVDGQLLSPLGRSGAVKKNVALDADALLRSPGIAQ